ncbi:unnamed protein product [Caenorhabditis brenneri]
MPLVAPSNLDIHSCASLITEDKREDYQNRKKQAESIMKRSLPHHLTSFVDGHQLFSHYLVTHTTDIQRAGIFPFRADASTALHDTNPMEIQHIREYVSSVEDEFDEKITDLALLDIQLEKYLEKYEQLQERIRSLHSQCISHLAVLKSRCDRLQMVVTSSLEDNNPQRTEFLTRINEWQANLQQAVDDFEIPFYPESDYSRRTVDLFMNILGQIQTARKGVLSRMSVLENEEVPHLKRLYDKIREDMDSYATVSSNYASRCINIYREACAAENESAIRLMKMKHFIKRKEDEEVLFTNVDNMLRHKYSEVSSLEIEISLGCIHISKESHV